MSKPAQATIIVKPPHRQISRKRVRETIDAYSMLFPTILGVSIFFAVPLSISCYLSFTDSRLFGVPNLIGFQNYKRVFTDPTFYLALRNTTLFSLATLIFSTVPALFLAILLNEKIKGQAFFRTIFFIPVVASVVGISLLWRYLLNFDFGLINYALDRIGLPRIAWLTSIDTALISVIMVFSWKTIGYNMVIFLAGLQSIPAHLYEAADIDGASRWRRFIGITVPMLSPTTFFVLVTTLINCLQIFDIPYALGWSRSNTAGPADSMLTIVLHLYREGFIKFRMGYASSIAWILFIMIMSITLIQFRIANRWVTYE